MKKIYFLFILLAATILPANANPWTLENLPSPKGMGQNYYVSNPDSVLSGETELLINKVCTRLQANTMVELAVVVVDEFDEEHYYAYGFALDLFNRWGIGNAETNTGLLVFCSAHSRDIQIITGSGIEGIMTDAQCGQILDDNLYYLQENDFDDGILHICLDIESYLMEENNRTELMLGWRPKDTIISDVLTGYVFVGFIIMAILGFLGYKRLRGKPGQPEENILKRAEDTQSCMGCLSVFFPLPMLCLYLFYRFFRKQPITKPLICKECGHVMDSVPANLTKEQLKEEELRVYAYGKWHCPKCGAEQTIRYDGREHYRYNTCPSCRAYTLLQTGEQVITRANYWHSGERLDTYTCQCCGHVKQKRVILAQKHLSSGGSGSGGGGSWGGGRSSGGGAGRSF